jgi:hypothetical protein
MARKQVHESAYSDGVGKVNYNPESDNVEVRWMFEPDPVGPHEATIETAPGAFNQVRGVYTYKVLVRSTLFEHSKMVGEMPMTDATNMPKMARNIGILAGALTEELNDRFGDNVDPSEVARNAVDAFNEMVAEQKAAFLQETN